MKQSGMKEEKYIHVVSWNVSYCSKVTKVKFWGEQQVRQFLSPGQMDSQVDASQRKIANQNLRTDLRRVAKRIRKLARKSQKAVNFTHIMG